LVLAVVTAGIWAATEGGGVAHAQEADDTTITPPPQ
jgi:hypothetical protein